MAIASLLLTAGASPGLAAEAPERDDAPATPALAREAAPETVEPAALSSGQLTVQRITGGLSSPLGVVNAGDGSGRLFIVQRGGTVRVVKGWTLQAGSFLNIATKVAAGGERGLLGLAFHPDFETNRYLYAYYTRASDGDIILSRFTANSAGTSASSGTELILLRIEHSANTNHNGGDLAFGPDGYLYAAVGDGGGSGDPGNNGQDKEVLLGKVLRIDVNGTGSGPNDAYGIPADNPFVGAAGLDEIWAYGLRNPWRISFDRATGRFWIADVGQSRWEEVNREEAGFTGGRNYGWRVMEGAHCYSPSTGCNTSGKTLPIAEYSHTYGCSITGGYVYRGSTQRDLQGLYVFGDFCSGRLGTVPAAGTGLTFRRTTSLNITSFGESEGGELYVTDLGGALYRVIAPEFSDIANSRFLNDIHWLFYEGLTGGCGGGRYCPTATLTRGEMASFLARAMNLPSSPTDYFDDDDGTTHEHNINRIAHAGITGGCATRRFCPTATVTRAQLMSFMARALELPSSPTDYFDDDDGTTHEHNINRMAHAGLTGGCGTRRFCPNSGVTREQLAAFMRRAFD
jgi:glucose/arabinose dehydrogenase